MADSGGRRGAHHQAQTAFTDAGWLPLESGKVKEDGTARYVPFPQPHARDNDLDQGVTVEYLIHPCGALLVLPPDTDQEDILDENGDS